MQKRVLAIHDISCVGKCSLTVVLPIISNFGIECSVLPTAILSTHTGGFINYTYRDLECDLDNILNHFKSINLHVDAIYPGYLGNKKQIDDVIKYKEFFSESKLYLDPVFGDHGKLYSGFDLSYPNELKRLISLSDVLIPNITEACFLLGIEYREYTYIEMKEMLCKLSFLGPKVVVLTGVKKNGLIGAIAYNSETDKYYECYSKIVEGYFHGTGDIFSSVIVGSLMKNYSLEHALKLAVDFTYNSIKKTASLKTDPKYGVCFEEFLYLLNGDRNGKNE